MEAMAPFFPEPDRTFRVFFSLFHTVEAISKISALLSRNLNPDK
jgi:hypothetical protein